MIDVQPRSFPARALEFLLPQRCLECGRFGASLHEECVATLVRAERPRCRVCWAPSRVLVCARCLAAEDHSGFDELRTPLRFTGTARRALLEAKFRGVTTLLPPLARLAATSVEPVWRPEVVIPIPLARQREAAALEVMPPVAAARASAAAERRLSELVAPPTHRPNAAVPSPASQPPPAHGWPARRLPALPPLRRPQAPRKISALA